MKKLKTYVLAMFVIAMASCTHDDSIALEDNALVSKNQSNNVTMPTVQNGILFFTDKSHIDQYYEYLGEMVDAEQENPNTTNTSTSVETILDQFETQFTGYTSYRKLFNQLHDFENQGHSKEELISIFENTHAKGFEKSYFNTDFELGIGNKVYVYHSKDIILAFDKNRQDILNEIRTIEKGTGVLPLGVLLEYENDVQFISDIYDISTKMHLQVDYNLEYDSAPILQNKNCDVYEKAIGMSLMETIRDDEGAITSYTTFADAFATLTINWGDGNTTTTTYSTFSSQLLWHTYTSIDTFYATVTIGFYDLNGDYQTMSDPVTVEVEDACSEANGSVVDTVNDGSWLMLGELIVSNGYFGSSRIEGSTNAFKSCGSGCWTRASGRSNKPYNKVYISGKFRDSNCNQQSHKEGTGQSDHANEKIKIKTKYWNRYDHSNGDVRSEHRVSKDGSNLSLDLVYNPC